VLVAPTVHLDLPADGFGKVLWIVDDDADAGSPRFFGISSASIHRFAASAGCRACHRR
jgi:hypothetical protein